MNHHDVAIIGGGLAGLTLSLQLRRQNPELDIVVLERQQHPVPEAAHKVGESTVEIGAHYLSQVVGLKDHLESHQLKKFGLRFFFGVNGQDLSEADELGVSQLLAVPSYQLDRGILENELGQRALSAGIGFHPGCGVKRVAIDRQAHTVQYRNGDGEHTVSARWVVDAASRASPVKRHLGLGLTNDHDVNASWFRVEGRICVDDWSARPSWQERCPGLPRWLSTNHLMGPGYWVWLIPLSSETTSIGIVADPALHPLEDYNSHDKAMAWLRRHEPRCAAALEDSPPLDFRFLRHFSHDCRQVFSPERWALTGEAGVFLDPFYSPGSDFIAISNTYVSDLIGREMNGQSIGRRCRVLQQLYFSFFQSTLALYQDLYPGFGDRHLMVLKTVWDYAFYWAVLALLFFSRGLTDDETLLALGPDLGAIQRRNQDLQACFRERARRRICEPGRGGFFDQRAVPCLKRLNSELLTAPEGEGLARRLKANIAMLDQLAGFIQARVLDPELPAGEVERELLGDLPDRLR